MAKPEVLDEGDISDDAGALLGRLLGLGKMEMKVEMCFGWVSSGDGDSVG
jgi:hypothetical protein